MNIKKFNENADDMTPIEKAELLGNRLSNKFFEENNEFFDLIIEKDFINYRYIFRFDILYPETIEAITALDKYMGYNAVQIETKIFNNNAEEPLMYYWFNLNIDKINSQLEKFKLEDDTNKYNL